MPQPRSQQKYNAESRVWEDLMGVISKRWRARALVAAAAMTAPIFAPAAMAWEPTRTVEFIVPAGTGGGADQMARVIQGIIAKHGLMKQTMVVINKGGGEVAVQLVGKHVDSTVNNPIEAVAQWRAGALRPLCVFDSKPLPVTDKIAGDKSWADIPTCKSAGLDIEYLMLRGVFMPAG